MNDRAGEVEVVDLAASEEENEERRRRRRRLLRREEPVSSRSGLAPRFSADEDDSEALDGQLRLPVSDNSVCQ